MTLTEQQRIAINNIFADKGLSNECLKCKTAGPKDVDVVSFYNYEPGKGLVLGGSIGPYPALLTTCPNCGYVETYGAIALGVLKGDGTPNV